MTQYFRIEHMHRLVRSGIADVRDSLAQRPDAADDCRALNDVLLELPTADRFCIPSTAIRHAGSAASLKHFRIPELPRPLSLVFAPLKASVPGNLTPAIQCVVALPVTDKNVPPGIREDYRAEGVRHHGAWVEVVDAYMLQDQRWFVTPYAAYLPCGESPNWRAESNGGLGASGCACALLPTLASAIFNDSGHAGVARIASDACGTAAVWLWFEALRSCANVGVARSLLNDGAWSDYFVSKANPSRALYSGHVQPDDLGGAIWVPGAERSPFENDAKAQAFLNEANVVQANLNHRLN